MTARRRAWRGRAGFFWGGTPDGGGGRPGSPASTRGARFTPGHVASPWVVLSAVAARTGSLRLGTCVFLLPLDHPLDVAEEIATLDQVSGGRAFLGAGLGYRRYEWDALQLPYEQRGT